MSQQRDGASKIYDSITTSVLIQIMSSDDIVCTLERFKEGSNLRQFLMSSSFLA